MATHHPRRGLRDWRELMLNDHGFLRVFWHNLHEIRPGVWRSNQPTPGRVRAAARKGIKTILNLRGPRADGGWRLEKEACDANKMALVDFTIRSRAVPDRDVILEVERIFNEIEYPVLMHCKSGADRAGIMSVLYMLLVENASAAEAAKQLSLKYLHVSQAKTGLLDAFTRTYADAEKRGLSFREWVRDELDPEAIESAFQSRSWANRLVDGLLRRE
jgi:protein tyrosine/serine phosphatase